MAMLWIDRVVLEEQIPAGRPRALKQIDVFLILEALFLASLRKSWPLLPDASLNTKFTAFAVVPMSETYEDSQIASPKARAF